MPIPQQVVKKKKERKKRMRRFGQNLLYLVRKLGPRVAFFVDTTYPDKTSTQRCYNTVQSDCSNYDPKTPQSDTSLAAMSYLGQECMRSTGSAP